MSWCAKNAFLETCTWRMWRTVSGCTLYTDICILCRCKNDVNVYVYLCVYVYAYVYVYVYVYVCGYNRRYLIHLL